MNFSPKKTRTVIWICFHPSTRRITDTLEYFQQYFRMYIVIKHCYHFSEMSDICKIWWCCYGLIIFLCCLNDILKILENCKMNFVQFVINLLVTTVLCVCTLEQMSITGESGVSNLLYSMQSNLILRILLTTVFVILCMKRAWFVRNKSPNFHSAKLTT